jgi:pimeloyl-ACP methyl ester carboxylesterase
MNRYSIILICTLATLFTGCSMETTEQPENNTSPTNVVAELPTTAATQTASVTETAAVTPTPTNTTLPTAVPTETAIPTPEFIPTPDGPEIVTIEGVDRIVSTGTFFPSSGPSPWPGVILLHMSGDNRHVWEENGFADLLTENGYGVLAIDIRNHGDSGGDPSWDKGEADVRRWWNYFTGREDIDGERTALIGGSIGANLALFTGMQKTAGRTVVLLSPGLSYNSAPITEAVVDYGERPILMVASEDDLFPAVEDVTKMAQLALGEVESIIYEDAGHGTEMLEAKPELAKIILAWLAKYL